MKKLLFPVVAAATMMIGCAGDLNDTASLRESATQPFRAVTAALRGSYDITARERDVTVKWNQDIQTLEAWRGHERNYTHAAFRFKPDNGAAIIKYVPLADLDDQQAVVAALGVRSIGQLNKCEGCECTYLYPGEYRLDVVMFKGQTPKVSVPLGSAIVDNDVVAVRP